MVSVNAKCSKVTRLFWIWKQGNTICIYFFNMDLLFLEFFAWFTGKYMETILKPTAINMATLQITGDNFNVAIIF